MDDFSPGAMLLALLLVVTFAWVGVAGEVPRVFRTPSPPPAARKGDVWISPRDGAPMVFVPAGEFLMGSDESGARADERPAHKVYLDAFWIDKYEVTNERFRRFAQANQPRKQRPENPG